MSTQPDHSYDPVMAAIARHPARAARLRELEALAANTDDIVQAREAIAEIGRILDAAFAEAGVKRGAGVSGAVPRCSPNGASVHRRARRTA
ncbi:hypothetical protein [Streptomyces sp. NPDC059850]|uniref:hypothetical protein n=1 Tax=Streptomyces sp. NPDC059850 TaxID=3346970 RepID=UPI00364E26CA